MLAKRVVPVDYNFFNEWHNFENTIGRLFKPGYSLEIRVSNFNDADTVVITTDTMPALNELPQSISEVINKYAIIQHYINCFDDEFYLHFNIKFIFEDDSNTAISQFYLIKVCKLKQMMIL